MSKILLLLKTFKTRKNDAHLILGFSMSTISDHNPRSILSAILPSKVYKQVSHRRDWWEKGGD